MNNERNIATKEEKMRARKNDNRAKLIAVLVAFALIMLAGVIYLLQSNGGKIGSVGSNSFPYNIESVSKDSFIKSTKTNIVMLNNSLLEVINPANGSEVKGVTHFFSTPVFETNDKYIITYDQGRYNFRIDTASKVISEGEVKENILTACISDNGSYAIATVDGQSGSKITVYSKSLKELFTWKTTDSYIIDCELTSDGNTLAVATITSENAELKTTVHILNVKKQNEIKFFEYSGSATADLKYVSRNDLFVITDSFCAYISNSKESQELLKNGEQKIYNYEFSDGNLSVLYGSIENSHEYMLESYAKNGKKAFSIPINGDVKDIHCSSSSVSVLLDEKIEKYNMKGVLIGNAVAPKSATSFVQFGSKAYLLDVDKIILEKIEVV